MAKVSLISVFRPAKFLLVCLVIEAPRVKPLVARYMLLSDDKLKMSVVGKRLKFTQNIIDAKSCLK